MQKDENIVASDALEAEPEATPVIEEGAIPTEDAIPAEQPVADVQLIDEETTGEVPETQAESEVCL